MIDPGSMGERIQILELAADGSAYTWDTASQAWASAAKQRGKNLFSTVGLGAESWEFFLRAQPITLSNAISWRGEHYFITAITEEDRGWIHVAAAKIQPVEAERVAEDGWSGPVCLTERYIGYDQSQAPAYVEERMVMVCPKPLTCRYGDIIRIGSRLYVVTGCHTLDSHKNEYDIVYREDA